MVGGRRATRPARRARGARGPRRAGRLLAPLAEFLRTEAAGGAVLLLAVVVAVAWASSPWQASYERLWTHLLTLGPAGHSITLDLQAWVNDALMAIFFFVVGLEIKRELVVGELRDRRTALLPAIAALGGMALPAILYVAITAGGPHVRGWAIPMATDIAFVVGVLAVLGDRVPSGLRLFLLTLAIVDDIGAIVVIALFYSNGVEAAWLAAAFGCVAVVLLMRRDGIASPLAYVPIAIVLWICTYESGIHPTIAGVALGLLTPARPVRGRDVLGALEHRLHSWSSYVIVPVFALANAGVHLDAHTISAAFHSDVAWGVIVGLVVGKLVGITSTSLGVERSRLGHLPADVGRGHLVGGAALAGIGFTVSLFVAELAFRGSGLGDDVKVAILTASVISGALGAAILAAVGRRAGAGLPARRRRGAAAASGAPRRRTDPQTSGQGTEW